MNIIFLTKKMDNYNSASYQRDIILTLKKKSNIYLYGPGYDNYDINDNYDDIVEKSGNKIDFIVFGHSFLSDVDGSNEDLLPNLDKGVQYKNNRIGILNKEYVNLDYKLEFFKYKKISLCFTHHHDFKLYQNKTNIKFIFWPFAVNFDKFYRQNIIKKFDIGFTGVIQNLNINANQSDIRKKIMLKFFYTLGDVKMVKRNKYSNLKIFWEAVPRNKFERFMNSKIFLKKRLSEDNYVNLLNECKVFINTLSPMELISPRFFETISSKAVVLCEKSYIYSKIIDKKYILEFKKDLSDFDEKLNHALDLSNDAEYIRKASDYVKNFHTWDLRIDQFINENHKI